VILFNKILKPVLALLLSTLLCLLVLEGLTRIFFTTKLDYQIEMSRYAGLMKRQVIVKGSSHAHLPDQQAKLMGVDVTINAKGFRDKDYEPKKPDNIYRIMLLGDSLTFGWGVKAEDRFSDLLEARLNKEVQDSKYGRFEVINTGVGNYNTVQEVNFYEMKGRAWEPDMVILNFFINDAEPTPTKRSPFIIQYSYLAMWLWGRLDTMQRIVGVRDNFLDYYSKLYDDDKLGLKIMKEALERISEITDKDGTELLMVLLPELHVVGKEYKFADIYNKVKGFAHQSGINHVIDLSDNFKGQVPETLWVSPDDAHPNAEAHKIIAEGILSHLLKKYFKISETDNSEKEEYNGN